MICEYPENKPRTAYNKGCRCDPCKAAQSAYKAKRNGTPEAKAKQAEYDAEWFKTPKGRACKRAACAKRKATKLKQTPDYANLELIRRIYHNCPEGFHVEHMLPLSRGGLHHENNLCYLPEAVNVSKGDRTIEEFGQEKFHASAVYWQTIL